MRLLLGEIKINLATNNHQDIITIKDTGIGIPAADISHIFERFYRVNTDLSRNSGGSGLGLAIALAITQTHKGKLEVQTQIDYRSMVKNRIYTGKTHLRGLKTSIFS